MRFSFGTNWLNYSRSLDADRFARATRSVSALLDPLPVAGRSFVDVGCGSGLFALAAIRLGARRVVALDRDPDCLRATAENAVRLLSPEERARLEVREGDVLVPASLPPERFDVVYAWGSLHHTGAMWEAVETTASLCADDGVLVLALYNRTPFTGAWHAVKRAYNASPRPLQAAMVSALVLPRAAARLLRGRPPLRVERGMDVWYDAVDWLGGLPYEAATPVEVHARLAQLGFRCVREELTRRHGCNQFVYGRNGTPGRA